MGYSAMIKKNVKKAFGMAGDLVTLVTLSQKNNTAFNFTTEAVTSTSTVTTTIKGLFVNKKRPSGDKLTSTLQTSFQFMSEDLKDPDIYDTITMPDASIWKMVPPYEDDGYIITVNVAKEA